MNELQLLAAAKRGDTRAVEQLLENLTTRDRIRRVLKLFQDGTLAGQVLVAYLFCAKRLGEIPTVREIGEMLGRTDSHVSAMVLNVRRVLRQNGITLFSAR